MPPGYMPDSAALLILGRSHGASYHEPARQSDFCHDCALLPGVDLSRDRAGQAELVEGLRDKLT